MYSQLVLILSLKTEAKRGEARQIFVEAKRGELDFLKLISRRDEARLNINEAKRVELVKYCLVSLSAY